MELRSRVVGALGTLALAVPAATLLVHCSSFSASEETADGGDGAALVEGGSADATDGSSASDASDAGDGAPADFCATAEGGLVCENFETPGALDDARYEVVNQVSLESPGFQSAHGIVATAAAKSNAVFNVPTVLAADAKHITISAAIRLEATPTTEVDLIAVEIAERTLELYVHGNLTVSFASCGDSGCIDLTAGTKKVTPGTYARLELTLDLTGEQVIASGTVDGAAAFAAPIIVTTPVAGASFSSMFGVVYSEKPITVHVDDVFIQAK